MLFNPAKQNAEVKERFINEYSFILANHFFDRTEITPWINQKMQDVQIENNYDEFMKDSVSSFLRENMLKSMVDKIYDFDDYTRFSTVADVIVEIIPELKLRERGKSHELIMPYIINKSGAIDSVLILLDGIPILTNEFIKLNPFQLKSVSLIFEQIKFGYAEYRGVAMFSSIAKDASVLNDLRGYSRVDLLPFQEDFKYYQPDYGGAESTMPDHRSQLLWETTLDLDKKNIYRFYTSDLTGTFEVVLQSRDKKGNESISRNTFEVVK
jgi:hypothetical protein